MSFTDLELDHRIVKTLDAQSFTEPTLIQQRTIPYALLGRDVLACSRTGSGKTFAFVLPILHRLLKTKALSRKDPRALILAPTRELAKQVFIEIKKLCTNLSIQPQLIVGGENYNDQVKALRRNPHIIVGTAGRVADHLSDRSLFLNGLEVLVYDEADRMLDLGFAEELLAINRQADHRKRQTMLFSATLDSPALTAVTDSLLKTPERIILDNSFSIHADIAQRWYFTDHIEHKQTLLAHLLTSEKYNQAIVFCATREDTETLKAILAKHDVNAVALRGDLLQSQRANIMSAFSAGQHDVLVTTDVASRGLDLKKVSLVINFDLPKQAEEYVHRIGRTGRAGSKGNAIALVGPRDWQSFIHIQQNLGQTIEITVHPDYPAKFKGIDKKGKIHKANQQKTNSPKNHLVQGQTKRVDTISGVDVGHMPIIKKKPSSE